MSLHKRSQPQTTMIAAAIMCGVLGVVHFWLGLDGLARLRTSGFDLSVFDYALWTTVTGEAVGSIPMLGHSIFAHHFMPTLLLLAPFAAFFDTPVYLIAIQALAYSVAAFLFHQVAVRQIPASYAWALTLAFLLSRRVHSAVASSFHIESLEPALIFGLILAWSNKRWTSYFVLLALALGCKEDVAVYVGMFGAVSALRSDDPRVRRVGWWTAAIAAAWCALAVFVFIPAARGAEELERTNPFVEGRYGVGDIQAVDNVVARALSWDAMTRIVTVASATGFLCLASPSGMAIALPGVLLNLGALPDSPQAGLTTHYLWPILPWLFLAGVSGARRVHAGAPRWLPIVVLLIACADMQLPRTISGALRPNADADRVRAQLSSLSYSGRVDAQANLIPHLRRTTDVRGLGVNARDDSEPDYILLTTVGDPWPLGIDGIRDRIGTLGADPAFETILDGPLFAFRRYR